MSNRNIQVVYNLTWDDEEATESLAINGRTVDLSKGRVIELDNGQLRQHAKTLRLSIPSGSCEFETGTSQGRLPRLDFAWNLTKSCLHDGPKEKEFRLISAKGCVTRLLLDAAILTEIQAGISRVFDWQAERNSTFGVEIVREGAMGSRFNNGTGKARIHRNG